jgi:hypothetical protein
MEKEGDRLQQENREVEKREKNPENYPKSSVCQFLHMTLRIDIGNKIMVMIWLKAWKVNNKTKEKNEYT